MSRFFEDPAFSAEADAGGAGTAPMAIPDYLSTVYTWAYLHPRLVPLLDHQPVVQAILWGNANRLVQLAAEEFSAGETVLQPASVYGCLSRRLAETVGPAGSLDVHDIAPIQVTRCRAKLAAFPQARVSRADAAVPVSGTYDGVCCFFLLHEVPDDYKHRIVTNMLAAVKPGGKAVFVDYHRWHRLHPMGPIMHAVFCLLEPFAASLCASEIRAFGRGAEAFVWSKETLFGGLYQKVVARRI